SKEVRFTLSEEDLKFYNYNLDLVAEPGEFIVFIGGNSDEVREARFKLE
ncbi:MAG: fibronectin type III-like domain-contianing protein, partial [Mariniphaga sp.]